MRTQLIRLLLQGLSLLPLRVNHALGSAIGLFSWALHSAERRIAEINLALCFPDQPEVNQTITRQCLKETGKSLTELGWIWHRSKTALNKKIVAIDGGDLLRRARQSNRGTIIISPHIGSWELAIHVLAEEPELLLMYRTPRMAALDPILRAGRSRFGASIVPLNTGGIKSVLKSLKSGGAVGILPDQEPDRANGTFAPFFGVQANTMNLLNRLATKSNANLIMLMIERLPRGAGYKVHLSEASAALRNSDLTQATMALNREVETCVQQAPTQYLWSYKRFSHCNDGSRRNYRKKRSA